MGPAKRRRNKGTRLSDVSVEDFMAGGLSSDSEDEASESSARKKNRKAVAEPPGAKVPGKTKMLPAVKNSRGAKQSNEERSDSSDDEAPEPVSLKRDKVKTAKARKLKHADSESHEAESDSKKTDSDDAEEDSDSDLDMEKNKEIVRKLKDTDPDFYQYLEEHDKDLLDFYTNDAEEDDDAADSADEETEEAAQETPSRRKQILKLEHIEKFRRDLQMKPDVQKITDVISCFRAAVMQAEGDEATPQSGMPCKYRVEGQIVFNAVVKLCLNDLLPALHKVLNLPAPSVPKDDTKPFDPTKCHSWRKASLSVKIYLMNVVKLVTAVTEPQLVSVLLRHILFLVPYYIAFPQVAKTLLKRLITLWCEGEETVRVVAFLCLVRMVRGLPRHYLDTVLKHMYMSYVRNSKFTSPSTWPLINFMKRSLAEIYSQDEGLAYQHAFLYIRQLAIHLRNALTVRKKDTCKAVYNWQYVHCCLLWCHFLATVVPSEMLKPLIYPLVQTIVGTIQLVPAAKFVPLRFHLVRGLIQLGTSTGVFVPIMPHLLDVFSIVNFNQKHTSMSMRPIDLSCVLRVSPTQMKESGFRDAVVEGFYELTLEYLSGMSHSVAFPELVLPAIISLKEFNKKCKVANYNKRVKQLVDKMEENYKFVENKRKNCGVALTDTAGLDRLENTWKEQGTPWTKFYEQWSKLRSKRQVNQEKEKVLTKLPPPESDDSDEEREKKRAAKAKKKKSAAEKRQKASKTELKEDPLVLGEEDVLQDMALSSTSEEESNGSEEDSDVNESESDSFASS